MTQAECILKFRDKNNKIYGYRLQDTQGNQKDVTPDQLKTAIKNHQITIINLKLTSDNRLVDTTPTQQSQTKSKAPQILDEQKIKNKIYKAQLMGFSVKEIPTACNHKCYLISESSTQHTVYIPDDVTKLNTTFNNLRYILEYTEHIQNLQGTLKVIGGKNLKDVEHMFRDCKVQYIDFSSFDTSNITNMRLMFYKCRVQSLDLSSFDTSNVTDMKMMFSDCSAQSLDLSSFNTSKVTCMSGMFSGCSAQYIDLSSFDTSNVTDMHSMFWYCNKVKFLDLSNFNTSKVTNMSGMFVACNVKSKSLDLSSFDTSKVTDMSMMFQECKAKFIDLSSFNTSNVINMNLMFSECQAKSLDLSSFDTSNVRRMSQMFEKCKAEFIDLSSFNASNVRRKRLIKDMFYSCQARIKVTDKKILKEYMKGR